MNPYAPPVAQGGATATSAARATSREWRATVRAGVSLLLVTMLAVLVVRVLVSTGLLAWSFGQIGNVAVTLVPDAVRLIGVFLVTATSGGAEERLSRGLRTSSRLVFSASLALTVIVWVAVPYAPSVTVAMVPYHFLVAAGAVVLALYCRDVYVLTGHAERRDELVGPAVAYAVCLVATLGALFSDPRDFRPLARVLELGFGVSSIVALVRLRRLRRLLAASS